MKRTSASLLSRQRKIRSSRLSRPLTLLLVLSSLIGCAGTPDREQIPQFRQGAATANQQTLKAFSEVNSFLRTHQVDRVVAQQSISESDFLTVLANEDVAKWSIAFSILDSYAKSLEALLDPNHRKDAQADLVKLGETIEALDGKALPSSAAGGFATLGGLLIQLKSETDAMEAIRKADPGVQATLDSMMETIGGSRTDGVRSITHTAWQTRLGQIRADFRRARNTDEKRTVALRFVAALDQRDAQDASLSALHRSLGLLATAHSEIAAGRKEGAQGVIEILQREYASYQTIVDARKKP